MIYKKLFELSGLSNHEITKRLKIQHNERQQFENRETINLDRLVKFCKALDVNPVDLSEAIRKEILKKAR